MNMDIEKRIEAIKARAQQKILISSMLMYKGAILGVDKEDPSADEYFNRIIEAIADLTLDMTALSIAMQEQSNSESLNLYINLGYVLDEIVLTLEEQHVITKTNVGIKGDFDFIERTGALASFIAIYDVIALDIVS